MAQHFIASEQCIQLWPWMRSKIYTHKLELLFHKIKRNKFRTFRFPEARFPQLTERLITLSISYFDYYVHCIPQAKKLTIPQTHIILYIAT